LNAARTILEIAKKEGVKYVIGIPGSASLPFYDALYEVQPDIQPLVPKHEQTGTFIADGYARVTGVPCIVTGTVGPGAINVASGLHTSYQDSVPVLAITPNVGSAQYGKGAVQEASGWGRTISHVKFFSAVTKWSVEIISPERVPDATKRAFRVMLTGRRGPVHLDIPLDYLRAEIDFEPPESPTEYRPVEPIAGNPKTVKSAAELLLKAESPAILAGGGTITSNASPELIELAELLFMPIATTAMGKGAIPEDHPLALGCAGVYAGQEVANTVLTSSNTDVLLIVGTILHEMTTKGWRRDFGGRINIQIDVDPEEIGKNYPVSIGIVGDAKIVLRQILEVVRGMLDKPRYTKDAPRIQVLEKARKELGYYNHPLMYSDAKPMPASRALKELRECLPRDAIVFADCGNNLAWAVGYFPVYTPKGFLADGAHTAMGFSVAAAIGAKLGAPDRQVVDIAGDASFMMSSKELGTARYYNAPVMYFILNDGLLGMIRHTQRFLYDERYIATVSIDTNPDFCKFAEAFGCYGERVEDPAEIKYAIKRAKDAGVPSVIDVLTDSNTPVPALKARAEMFRRLMAKK